jgi:hypothetical protein
MQSDLRDPDTEVGVKEGEEAKSGEADNKGRQQRKERKPPRVIACRESGAPTPTSTTTPHARQGSREDPPPAPPHTIPRPKHTATTPRGDKASPVLPTPPRSTPNRRILSLVSSHKSYQHSTARTAEGHALALP